MRSEGHSRLAERAAAPRVRLAQLPTPLERAERLAPAVRPALWIKRDDCTGLAGGGNKTRKLEFLLGRALAEGADTVVTTGGVQSNHARQTAAACARLGLACELFVDVPLRGAGASYEESGNALLDRLLGARVHVIETEAELTAANHELERAAGQRGRQLRAAGRRPFVVPMGGSSGTGALGYVEAGRELAEQCAALGFEPDAVVVATSSGATQLGLASGLAEAGCPTRVIGVCVGADAKLLRARIGTIARELEQLGAAAADVDTLELDESELSPYGEPTAAAGAAIRRAARAEGLLLDPVYTGKAMAALLALVEQGPLSTADNVVFVHTGGWPALFGYRRWVAELADHTSAEER